MINFTVGAIGVMNEKLRRFIEYMESENVDDDAVFDSRLVSCELITNALRHCGSAALFCGTVNDDDVVISVRAENPCGAIKVPSLPDVLSESGRGLYIVNAISGGNVVISGGNVTVVIKRNR